MMMLRIQKERMTQAASLDVTEYHAAYGLTQNRSQRLKPEAVVMHPGPINRGIEVDDLAADSERSAIHAQIENGVFVRMASLYWVFSGNGSSNGKPAAKAKTAAKVKA